MSRILLACAAAAAACGLAIPLTAGAADGGQPVFTSSGTVTFDFVPVGQAASKTVTISNPSATPMTIATVDFSGPDTADFAITSNTCAGAKLSGGAQCKVGVRFAPVVSGTRVAALRFTDDTPCKNFVTVAGSGTDTPQLLRAHAATCQQAVQVVTTPGQSTTNTVTTNTTTTVTVPTVNGAAAITLPKSCVSRRTITFHLAAPAGKIFKKVTAKLGKKTFKTLKGKNIKSTVSLKGLPRGRFTLTIVGTLTNGKTIKQTRKYVTCVSDKK